MTAAPAAVLDALRRRFGAIQRCERVPSTQAAVWRVEFAETTLALKVFGSGGAGNEEAVLRSAAAAGLSVPRLRWTCTAPVRALATDWLEGSRPGNDPEHHRAAGAFLAALHALPVERDPLPWSEALRRRRDGWLARSDGVVSPELRERFEGALTNPIVDAIAQVAGPRVLCHRDFERRNWLVDRATSRLHVLDFGQARADAWLWDLVKLAEGDWVEAPATAEAFFAGYGRSPSDPESRALQALGVLHGFQTLVWGRIHGDREFVRRGGNILARRWH